ncbi:MAG: HEAT repeat domain-containing protein [Verrucomicrobia bacterium]|nr:HEAT repeat domain-containing protein [Verrucomicrobiota bacterium]
MRYLLNIAVIAGTFFLQTALYDAGAASGQERQLIELLRSDASLHEKDAACAQLKHIGTVECVDVLSELLTNPELSHSARYALELMEFSEAGDALINALGETDGQIRIGIINSVGIRGDKRAVPALKPLLAAGDAGTASAAAAALGRIGGEDAAAVLVGVLQTSGAEAREAVVDSILACAQAMLSDGKTKAANRIFKALYDAADDDVVRAAAFRGIILSSGEKAIGLVKAALNDRRGPEQAAAMGLVRGLKASDAAEAVAAMLPDLTPHEREALIENLAQRGDPAAAPKIAVYMGEGPAEVRVAAIKAIGLLGNAVHVSALVRIAAADTDTGARKAARYALLRINRGDVNTALLTQLESDNRGIVTEAARALSERGERGIVPDLLESAQKLSGNAFVGACSVLQALAGPADVPALVGLVSSTENADERIAAANALGGVFRRASTAEVGSALEEFTHALRNGDVRTRVALLGVCAELADERIRNVVRSAVHDEDAAVRRAAVDAVCETRDPELMPELLEIVSVTDDAEVRLRAVRGSAQLIDPEVTPGLSDGERVDFLESVLNEVSGRREKWILLSALAKVSHPRALEVIRTTFADTEVRAEAIQAAIQVSREIYDLHPDVVETVLKQALDAGASGTPAQEAREILAMINELTAYITDWKVAGPYRMEGQNYAALFDTPFPPERDNLQSIEWRDIEPGSAAGAGYVIDLLNKFGGEQCVAYAVTRLHSATKQPVRFLIGSDDGIKVWLNGDLIHANNVARPITPDSDAVDAVLEKGWNTLLLKVSQNNLGWEFCVRPVAPDGTEIEGLRIDST